MRIVMLLHKSLEFDSRVQREASALGAAGHQVCVLELGPVSPDAATMDGYARRSVLPRRGRRPGRLGQARSLLSFVGAVVRLRPEVVHAHDVAMLLPGIVGARLVGAGVVYDTHELATGVPYRERLWAGLVAALERLFVRRCAAVITVSDGIADRLVELYRLPRRPIVVRNVSALRPSGPGGLRTRLGVDRSTPVVLHQGAPAPGRGCAQLVHAAASLEDVHVAFLGDPDPGYGRALERLIAARGVQQRVKLLPSVPPGELLAWTAEADVGVTLLEDTCENHRLALPNKLFEYIAAGIPVVAGALPEIERLVRSYEIGWCAKPDDPDDLACTLRRALPECQAPQLRKRLAAAAAELTWAKERLSLLELYRPDRPGRGVLATKGPRRMLRRAPRA